MHIANFIIQIHYHHTQKCLLLGTREIYNRRQPVTIVGHFPTPMLCGNTYNRKWLANVSFNFF